MPSLDITFPTVLALLLAETEAAAAMRKEVKIHFVSLSYISSSFFCEGRFLVSSNCKFECLIYR